jgi:hypothetical protein
MATAPQQYVTALHKMQGISSDFLSNSSSFIIHVVFSGSLSLDPSDVFIY